MLINTAVLYNDGHYKNHVFTYAMEHFKTSSLPNTTGTAVNKA